MPDLSRGRLCSCPRQATCTGTEHAAHYTGRPRGPRHRHYKVSTDKPWAEMPEKARQAILYGTGEEEVTFHYDDGLRSYKTTKTFEGVIPNLERRWKETESAWMREEIERYHSAKPCDPCHGYRLKPEALAV